MRTLPPIEVEILPVDPVLKPHVEIGRLRDQRLRGNFSADEIRVHHRIDFYLAKSFVSRSNGV
jgi:hypothetical protein